MTPRKPFSYPELRARVGALLARANQRRAMGRLRVGDLEVHPSSRRVLLRGTPIELSQKEFALLRTLATEPTKVWTKEELLRSIWGFRSMGSYRRLRQENRCVVSWRIDHADCLQAMAAMPAGSVDAIVTDPPYGLEFMGKEWDRFGVGANYAGITPGNDSPHARRNSVNYTGSATPTCRTCGGLRSLNSEGSGGRKKCRCDSPDFPNMI